MDYLSGKQIGQNISEKPEKISKKSKKDESIFSAFCNTAISCLNPDEQADICERFLKPEIISVNITGTEYESSLNTSGLKYILNPTINCSVNKNI